MAKPKSNLDAALRLVDVQEAPPPVAVEASTPRTSGRPRRTEKTKLVGAQLGLRYSKSLNMLAAETGKSNRVLLEEALDKLFVAYGAKELNQ